MSTMIGEVIDHYRVLELIGRGAMGVVYKALDVNLDRQVAIKVMSAEARNDPDFVERFRQEARMQGALNHPNIAMLFDYFVHDGAPVAVMELIDGESLEQLIHRRGAIPVRESIPIFKQALRGVAAAHRAGIIHRDLKPSNLMVTRDDIVKVMDFGIAKRQGAPGATKVSSTSIGSPLYMAPEQILGRPVDCRTDVYALGLTLYELLTGCKPFNPRGKAEYMVLNAHVNDLPEPPTVYRFGLPQPIVDAVMCSLAKDPAARFQSAEEFMRALPDVTAPDAGAAAAPRVGPMDTVPVVKSPPLGAGPTGTVALTKSPPLGAGPTGTVALAKSPPLGNGPTGTVALTKSPPLGAGPSATGKPSGTTIFEYAETRRTPNNAMAFDYSASTVLLQESDQGRSTSTPATTPPPSPAAHDSDAPQGLMQRLRDYRPAIAAALITALVFGALIRYAVTMPTTPRDDSLATRTPPLVATQPSAVTEAPAASETLAPPPPAVASSALDVPPAQPVDAAAATAERATATPLDISTAPARPDLSGTWRGEYVDASGKQLLRVVSLNISRVQEGGGIEGTLQYQAASGAGQCQLHPRRSTFLAGEHRLQLSPESCSPHYPRELGVPLDFDRVNPRANALGNGRIETPTGEVIRVRLRRVNGV